jgi:hypothetical protein
MAGGPPYVCGYVAPGDLGPHPWAGGPSSTLSPRSPTHIPGGSLTRLWLYNRNSNMSPADFVFWWRCENLTLSHPEPNKQSVLSLFVHLSTVTFSGI